LFQQPKPSTLNPQPRARAVDPKKIDAAQLAYGTRIVSVGPLSHTHLELLFEAR
jgi:hypothetical protein